MRTIGVVDLIGIPRELPLLVEGLNMHIMQVIATHPKIESQVFVAMNPGQPVPTDWDTFFLQRALDVKDAAGYHDMDAYGRAYGKIALPSSGNILRDPKGAGDSLLGIAQHEAAENAGDESANIWVQSPFRNPRSGRTYNLLAYELCDPVQEVCDAMTLKDGTVVDRIAWVYPLWFEARRAQCAQVDSHGALTEPLTLAPGGYQIAAQIGAESNVFAKTEHGTTRAIHIDLIEHHDLGLAQHRMEKKNHPSSRTSKRLRSFDHIQ